MKCVSILPQTVLLMEGKATAICFVGADDIIVGCDTGHVYCVDLSRRNTITPLFAEYTNHGAVVSISYLQEERVLVVGYKEHTVLIDKLTMGLHTPNSWRVYCESLLQKGCVLHTLLCIHHDQEAMEVWCGCSNSSVEVWTIRTNNIGLHSRLQRDSSVVPVHSPFNQGVQACVRGMRLREHQESPWVVALLQEESVYSVACFDVKSGTVLKYLECPFQGKWSTLSNSHLPHGPEYFNLLINCAYACWY